MFVLDELCCYCTFSTVVVKVQIEKEHHSFVGRPAEIALVAHLLVLATEDTLITCDESG